MMTPLALVAALEANELPELTAERLRDALALTARDLAVRRLAGLLDPEGRRSCWWIAGEVERLLRRFEGTAWPRIRAGHRQPRGALPWLISTAPTPTGAS